MYLIKIIKHVEHSFVADLSILHKILQTYIRNKVI